ncbi:serine/threonine-protein kinase pakD isoform X3 [Drosophila sulfurigaster albostrigata]|uniref:serine/threonine-protein kinase pakD isoform X2 n=1 Tax=Drosophila sulfurigaster albostrigata TaxID=89887 RepID=UPI002D219314|nr:serine/threonine-protein kinase pakD isoform X2 [Drosophila sulfurigaster albostrigata]XP_062135622.1 serine/threonine-protein kinase pakD isoform X3 [Drosophila sulfurigaster albostrigata]
MVNKQYTANDLEAFMKIAANWQSTNHNLLEGVDLKQEMTQYMNSPSMNMYKKRERTQNWNHQEKKYLLDLCRKDMRIIENKRLDAGLTAVKNKAWKIIHQKFSNQFGTDRTCNRLKEQWRRMKACTRNEILDYNNRLARFGAEVADRKKPSPFTFEVWDFMQEAKKACKSEALDGIDYSKIPLALEEDFEYRDDYKFNADEHDMDDSRTPPQELCDVDIKEEETNETFNETYNNHSNDITVNGERLSVSPNHSRNGLHEPESPAGSALDTSAVGGGFMPPSGSDMSGFQPSFNMNNISATLEALNALRSGQFPSAAAAAAAAIQQHQAQAQAQAAALQQHSNNNNNNNNNNNEDDDELPKPLAKRQRTSSSSLVGDEQQQPQQTSLPMTTSVPQTADSQALERSGVSSVVASSSGSNVVATSAGNSFEMRMFMEMQSKEHMMRMKILEVQLQAAKHSRDLVEINKTLALQKLQELASKRLPS